MPPVEERITLLVIAAELKNISARIARLERAAGLTERTN